MSIPRWHYLESSNLQVGGRAKNLVNEPVQKTLWLGSDTSTFQKQWENEWVARANCFFSAALMNIVVIFRRNTIFRETKVRLLKCNSQCFLHIKLFIYLQFGLTSMFFYLCKIPPSGPASMLPASLLLVPRPGRLRDFLAGGWESLLNMNRYEDFWYVFLQGFHSGRKTSPLVTLVH